MVILFESSFGEHGFKFLHTKVAQGCSCAGTIALAYLSGVRLLL